MNVSQKPHFVALDSFGAEVLHHLRALAHDDAEFVQLATGEPLRIDPEVNVSDLYVPIAGSTMRALCLELDAQVHRHGFQFMPVTIDCSLLQVGPHVVPRRTPCWECWNERVTSQHYFPEERSFLLAEHDRRPSASGPGFMPFTALLAALRIAEATDTFKADHLGFGTTWTMNIFTRDVSSIEYTGRHRCPKCRPLDLPRERSIGALQPYINELS